MADADPEDGELAPVGTALVVDFVEDGSHMMVAVVAALARRYSMRLCPVWANEVFVYARASSYY